jgi:predicted O-methyltransferase YrrM
MEFIDSIIEKYAEDNSTPESDILARLNRETHLKVLKPRMLSGHLQGRMLSMFSKLLQPKRILEIGTYTGYSAICLAEGLANDGVLHTIDVNEEIESIARKYWDEAGVKDQIVFHCGVASEIIPQLNETFDLVFIDADKSSYPAYFDMVVGSVRQGGLIIADNVLWSGKVVESVKKNDKDTKALLEYAEKVQNDPRVENILLPIRDGLYVSRVL